MQEAALQLVWGLLQELERRSEQGRGQGPAAERIERMGSCWLQISRQCWPGRRRNVGTMCGGRLTKLVDVSKANTHKRLPSHDERRDEQRLARYIPLLSVRLQPASTPVTDPRSRSGGLRSSTTTNICKNSLAMAPRVRTRKVDNRQSDARTAVVTGLQTSGGRGVGLTNNKWAPKGKCKGGGEVIVNVGRSRLQG